MPTRQRTELHPKRSNSLRNGNVLVTILEEHELLVLSCEGIWDATGIHQSSYPSRPYALWAI